MTTAVVYCDGSGVADGGPAGCGYVALINARTVTEGSLPLPAGTNQQAEILAAAYALTEIPDCAAVLVYSDSEYVVKGWTEWLPGWLENGWRRRSGGDVANQRHWQRLIDAADRHGTVEFRWVRGHDGTEGNERADVLAGEARARAIEQAAA